VRREKLVVCLLHVPLSRNERKLEFNPLLVVEAPSKRKVEQEQKLAALRQTETFGRLIAMTEAKEKRVKVTPKQMTILMYLPQHHQISIGELAALLGRSSAATTKNVHRLEQKRLVKRVVDEWDRRRILVSLTDAGRSVVHAPSE